MKNNLKKAKYFCTGLMLFAALFFSVTIFGGCAYAGDYYFNEGITATFYSKNEAELVIILEDKSNDTQSTTEEDGLDDTQAAIELLEGTVSLYFTFNEQPQTYSTSGYIIKIFNVSPRSDWELSGDVHTNSSFLYAKVDIAYQNPFAQTNSPFFELKNRLESDSVLSTYNLTSVLTVLLPCSKHSISGAKSVLKDYSRYAEFTLLLEDRAAQSISLSYKAMVSAGWFAIALAVGGLITLTIILFAKKNSGSLIALNSSSAAHLDPFDPTPTTQDVFNDYPDNK